MARTTTRDIIKVCADLARMDRRAKEEVLAYLQDELKDSKKTVTIGVGGSGIIGGVGGISITGPEGGEQ